VLLREGKRRKMRSFVTSPFDGDIGDTDKKVDNLISVTLTDGEEDTGNDFVDGHTPTPKPTPKPPTKLPTRAPTVLPKASPTPASVRIVTKPPAVCETITIDLETAADGTHITRGDYVSDQWKSLGLQVAASGTESSKMGALIFDMANPGTREDGDPDLGAPNERCDPAG
jgi:hypothetical protein